MRIAVVTRYFPSSGEPMFGRSAYETLRVIARRHEVRVFYPEPAYPALLQPRSRSYKRLDPSFRPGEVDVEYHGFFALPLLWRPLNGPAAARTLLPHVSAFAPALIFSLFLYPAGFAALKIARALDVPVAIMSIGSDINRIRDPFTRRYTRIVLRQADAILSVSGDLRKKAIAMGAPSAKCRAILNGCDQAIFRPADRAQARERLRLNPASELIVYVGRMDATKGLRELVGAAAALHQRRPRLRLCLVGDGHDRALIESEIRSRGAGEYVRMYPGCAFEEVAVWMTAADVFTLPSYMEGCPNAVLEALACGRPVVATNVGGISEIMDESCGRLVPARDPARLAEALSEVLDSKWDPEAIAARWGRSWDNCAREHMEVFENLLLTKTASNAAG